MTSNKMIYVSEKAISSLPFSGSREIEDVPIINGNNASQYPKFKVETKRFYADGDLNRPINVHFSTDLPCLFDETFNFFYPVVPKYPFHALEEAKMSVRIEKINVKNNPENKFYLKMLELAEQELNKCLNEARNIKN